MNSIWLLTLLFWAASYFIFAILLRIGLNRKYPSNPENELSVSVIVSARNEAENIQRCLESLQKLDYPEHLLEIFIVNDRSEDGTHQIVSKFVEGKSNFKYLINSNVNTNLSGKANAIAQAIKKSSGEIIFITDADCEVPNGWVKNITSYFNNHVGMVAGFTLLDHSKGIFNKLQALDWGYLLSVAAGAIGLGIPLSCIGNNFAVRRSVFEQVGGYDGVGFSVAEDFALLKAIAKNTNWKLSFSIDMESLVHSRPVKSLKEFFSQRKRWAVGGKSVHWFGKIIIFTSVISQLVVLSSLFFSSQFYVGIAALGVMLMSDFLVVYSPMKKLNQLKLLKYLPIYKLFSLIYMLALSLILFVNRTVVWKGIKYTINSNR